jgi:hypothetical protein
MDKDKKSAQRLLHSQAGEYLTITGKMQVARDEAYKAESELRNLELAMAKAYYDAGYNGQLVAVDHLTIECDCGGDPTIRFIEDWISQTEKDDLIYDPRIVAAVYREQALKKEQKDNGNS